MNVFMEIFLFFVTILQFLFPFAFKDTEDVPVEPTDSVVEEVVPGDHVHTGGNCLVGAICDICGEEYGEAGEHVYIATIKQPTCTEGGYATYRCNLCFYSYTGDVTAPAGHKFVTRVVEATCTTGGYIIKTCSACGASETTKTEDAKGHSYQLAKTIPADCVNNAREVYTCFGCNNSYEKEIPGTAGGHYYVGVPTLPSCVAQGYTTYTCSGCNNSYKDDFVPMVPHSFTNYEFQYDATCQANGTKRALCDYGCGTYSERIPVEDSRLPHEDNNKDSVCDSCSEKLFIKYTYLQYTEDAVATIGSDVASVAEFTRKADADYGSDIYSSNKGTSYNSIIISPYFTANINGMLRTKDGVNEPAYTQIPVYGTAVFVGETQDGAVHSFSEIYVEKGEYDTFEIVLTAKNLPISVSNVTVLPESAGVAASVQGNAISAVLSGFGTYTFLINGDQRYAYTLSVREEVDEDAEIAALKAQGYNVYVVGDEPGDFCDSYVDDYECLPYVGENNLVIYLRKGSYLVAPHKYNINNSSDEAGYSENANTGTGQNRWAYLTANGCTNFKFVGYGAVDLGHLDRAERRGMIISFSTNVEIRGVKIFNSAEWTCFFYRCDGLTVKDVDVYGYRQNSDAFDICNSKNSTVTGCFARTGDDCFVVKTLGGDENAYSDNVTVSDCYAWTGKARAFGIFGEAYHHISNVTFKDSVVLCQDATWDDTRIPALGIVMEHEGDAATNTINVQNITFDNIEICRNDARAINVVVFGEDEFPTKTVNINNITFRNIRYKNTAQNLIDKYNPRTTITDVTFSDVFCNGTLLTDSNKVTYFTAKSYEGGYINFENTK